MEGKEERVEEKEEGKKGKGKKWFWEKSFFFSQSNLWASASEPAGSVPATQSQERGGDYRAMASSQGVLSEG